MAKSVISDYSKKEIDDVTKTIIGILKSGRKDSMIMETIDGTEREKNQIFMVEYDLKKEYVKELLKKFLKSQDICDVQIDERTEKLRQNNRMYIYCTDLEIIVEEHKKETVKIYIKIELLNTKPNKSVLLISLHKPEYNMSRKYDQLRG